MEYLHKEIRDCICLYKRLHRVTLIYSCCLAVMGVWNVKADTRLKRFMSYSNDGDDASLLHLTLSHLTLRPLMPPPVKCSHYLQNVCSSCLGDACFHIPMFMKCAKDRTPRPENKNMILTIWIKVVQIPIVPF